MNNEADVFLINTHAERNRGYYHLDFICHPTALDVLSFSVGQFGMVEIALDLIAPLQSLTHFFTILPTNAINNPRFILKPRSQQLANILFNRLNCFFISNFVVQIWTIERALEVNDIRNA